MHGCLTVELRVRRRRVELAKLAIGELGGAPWVIAAQPVLAVHTRYVHGRRGSIPLSRTPRLFSLLWLLSMNRIGWVGAGKAFVFR